MLFSEFYDKISTVKSAKLGGKISQFKLAPKARINFPDELIESKNPRKATVAVLFYPDSYGNTRLIITQRASYKGAHSAQISFVGGKIDPNETKKEALVREVYEEVGIKPSEIEIIRELSSAYIPPSNFLVYPFLCIMKYPPKFNPNYEVAEIIEVSLSDFLSCETSYKTIETSYMKELDVPYFLLNNKIVWGATAMILSEVKDLFKLSI